MNYYHIVYEFHKSVYWGPTVVCHVLFLSLFFHFGETSAFTNSVTAFTHENSNTTNHWHITLLAVDLICLLCFWISRPLKKCDQNAMNNKLMSTKRPPCKPLGVRWTVSRLSFLRLHHLSSLNSLTLCIICAHSTCKMNIVTHIRKYIIQINKRKA